VCYVVSSDLVSAEFPLLELLAFGGLAGPVLERVGEELAIEVGDALLQALLGVGDGFVVDGGADLLEELVEEESGGEIPDGLGQVLFEVLLEGFNGVGAGLLREFDGDHAVGSGGD